MLWDVYMKEERKIVENEHLILQFGRRNHVYFDNLLKYGKIVISGEYKPLFLWKKSKNRSLFFYT